MSPNDFFTELAKSKPGIATVPQLPIKVGKADILAAKLLVWLDTQLPPDATIGDQEDVLDAAKWWSVFFASSNKAMREMAVLGITDIDEIEKDS